MYINKAIIYGNLTRDPEVKALPSGIKVCNLAVATNRTWKDKNGAKQESVEFHNAVMFNKQAEVAGQYLKKGSAIYLEGRLQTRSWDGTDGQKKYRTEIMVDSFQFGPKSSGAGYTAGSSAGAGSSGASSSAPAKAGKPAVDAPLADDAIQYPEEEINADDIPF